MIKERLVKAGSRLLMALVVVGGTLVGTGGPALATAQCNHRTHTHAHNGHVDTWHWHGHTPSSSTTWVELFHNHYHNTYDTANCSVHT
jgi:hypothetical protein